MIIQCEQCRTKFRLDDEKVSDRGVKVRCAKCRHVFTVQKDAEQTAAAAAPVVDALDSSDETVRLSVTPSPEPAVAPHTTAPEVPFDFGAAPSESPATAVTSFDLGQTDATADGGFDFGDVSFSTEPAASAASEVDFGEMTMVMPPPKAAERASDLSLDFGTAAEQKPAVDAGFDFGDALASGVDVTAQKVEFDFGDQQTASVSPAGDIDLGGFDFGEATAAAASPTSDIGSTDFSNFSSTSASKPASGEQIFNFDDAVPQAAVTPSDGFDFSGVDFGPSSPTAAVSATPQIDSFSLDEMDFSGDTAAVAVASTDTAPVGALFEPVDASVAQQQQVTATPDISFEAPASSEEAPPLVITSRRRQSSTISIVVGIIAAVVVGALGYMAFSMLGKASEPIDEGKITVQNLKAYFVPKAAAGELLVITGEALNNHKKARAALQVKGMVFGANNQALANKTAYAGNPLSQDQIATMTADKIESAMNNQFGDSLANLEVQPGKTIPFTIVIINPPKDGRDFGVEPVGSTVAASK